MLTSSSFDTMPLWIFLYIELLINIMLLIGVLIHDSKVKKVKQSEDLIEKVTVIVCCYKEPIHLILKCVSSLIHQNYNGVIEIIAVVDGVEETYNAIKDIRSTDPKRTIQITTKKFRKGTVDSHNLGLSLATGSLIVDMDADTIAGHNAIRHMVSVFSDPETIGVSGTVLPHVFQKNTIAGLQEIEYRLGLQLSRTALSNFGMLNTISGAFGMFRTDYLRKIQGWRSGSGEDLDITIRIRVGKGKIVHKNEAVAYTDIPTTILGFMKQRFRWDGDLYLIIVKRYFSKLRIENMGLMPFLGVIIHSIYFCMVSPALIYLYLIYVLVDTNLDGIVTIFASVYIYYLLVSFVMYSIYIIYLSFNKKRDSKLYLYIFMYPIFQFASRIWGFIAIICEALFNVNKDSSMVSKEFGKE